MSNVSLRQNFIQIRNATISDFRYTIVMAKMIYNNEIVPLILEKSFEKNITIMLSEKFIFNFADCFLFTMLPATENRLSPRSSGCRSGEIFASQQCQLVMSC